MGNIVWDDKNRDEYYEYAKEDESGFFKCDAGFHITELNTYMRYIPYLSE